MIKLNNGIIIPSPISMMLFLTQDCQLRCTYCFEDHRHNEQMSFEIAKKAIDYIAKNAAEDNRAPVVTLFGGEPLLMWDEIIVPLVDYIRKTYDEFGINMTTNGLLLNEERLLYLRDNNVSIMLSIDGSKNGNDCTRRYVDNNKSVFDELEPIVDLILAIMPTTPFRMTVTPDNVKYLFESVEWFHNKGVGQLRAFPNIYTEWSEDALRELNVQLGLYNQYLYKSFNSKNSPLLFDIYIYVFKKILINQYELENDKYRSAYFCQTCNRCGIGLLGNFMCNAHGELFTCDRYVIPDDANPCYVGNLKDGVKIERIEKLFQLCDSNPLHSSKNNCNDCVLDHVCSGGCIPVNYQITGDFTEVPDAYCKYNRIVYKNVKELLEKFEKDKTCDSFKEYFQAITRKELRYVG